MVQGAVKQKASSGVQKSKNPGPKRGGKKIAPKKQALVKQLQLKKVWTFRLTHSHPLLTADANGHHQKLTASTIVETERQMAAKAGSTGKLTIMRGVADKAIKEQKKEQILKNKKKAATAAPAASASSKLAKK
ncbi:hypothetical protein HDU97_010302 [Phlyctochytrium planicorne]|nr:hypothetical protein HDU97_010302 [Phlyctochytrium planicorne]